MRRILTICLFLVSLTAHAYKSRDLLQRSADINTLKTILVPGHKWVTYPAYTDRQGWDKLFGENKKEAIKQGEAYLDYEWKVVKATDYIAYTRTGNRSEMERLHNSNLKAVSALFVAEMAEGRGRFIDQLINGIFHECEMTSWCNSAHLVVQKSRSPFPDYREQVIDLVSSDVGATFSWIHYFLHEEFDKITPLISGRLSHEIESRILAPYMESRFWWMAHNAGPEGGLVNNWNAWCNANVLQCFLLIEKDPDRLAEGVYKTMVSLDKFINYNHDDGACEEGPSYWGHAAGKMYDYLQVLYDATGGKISLFTEPMIKNMGEYIVRSYAGNGWVVNFADASAKGDFNYPLIYRFGKMVQSNEMQQFASFMQKEYPKKITVTRDMYRILADLSCHEEIALTEPLIVPVPFTWYPQTEFCYMRNGSFFFAGKGGYNDESHNHNDTGTFSLYVDNTPMFIDAGVGTYTSKTFGRDRYSIWTMQSDYHNLPRINGYPQAYGKKFKADNVGADEKKQTFSLDISGAYPAEAGVNSWKRAYELSQNELVIEDKFDIKKAVVPNTLNFLTWGKVDTGKAGVVGITSGHAACRLFYNPKVFDTVVETIALDDKRLSGVWGNEIYRITLVAKEIRNKGTYKIIIKSE